MKGRKSLNGIVSSLTGFFSALKWCLGILWETSQFYTAVRVLTEVLAPVLTITAEFIGRGVINLLASQAGCSSADTALLFLLVGLLLVAVVGGGLQKLAEYCRAMHEDKMGAKIANVMMGHALSADLEYFDNPAYYDKLNSASRDSYAIK